MKVYELIRWAARIISFIANTDKIAVALKMLIIVPVKGGITVFKACGRIILIHDTYIGSPKDFAASYCPLGTLRIPARMISLQ